MFPYAVSIFYNNGVEVILKIKTAEAFQAFSQIAGEELVPGTKETEIFSTAMVAFMGDYEVVEPETVEVELETETKTTKTVETETKTKPAHTVAQFRDKLSSDYSWATRGVVRIFQNQTADEQNNETTSHLNGIGFSGADAQILSSFAKQVIAGRKLSTKQQAILFKKMPKYAKQLHGIAYPKTNP